MIERVWTNQTGIQNKAFRPKRIKEALLDLQSWCYCGIAICITPPASDLGEFANIIISGFHFTVLQTQLLAMVLGAVIIIILPSSIIALAVFAPRLPPSYLNSKPQSSFTCELLIAQLLYLHTLFNYI